VSTSKIARFRRLVRTYAEKRLRPFPWRTRTTPYRVLVAELMLQRTGATQVTRVYGTFIKRFPTLRSAALARPSQLARALRPLGRSDRYRVISRAFRYLTTERGARIPADLEELLRIPAVGPYTARAVLCFAYGRAVGLLDPGVYRVLHRVFGVVSGRNRFHTDPNLWQFVDRIAPQSGVRRFNWALLDIAATLCLKRGPRCSKCPLVSICLFAQGKQSVAA